MDNLHETAPALLGSTLLANEAKLDSLKPGPLAFQVIASHLIAYEEGEVALIATTDPPLARLRDILVNRLARQERRPDFRQSGYVYQRQIPAVHSIGDIVTRVALMLERVRLSRVFDFPGVAEAIGEFGTRLEENDRIDRAISDGEFERARRVVNNDDEAESSLSSDVDDKAIRNTTMAKAEAAESLPARMIVIDNIANVAGSMMNKNQSQGVFRLAPSSRKFVRY
ncbi:MAG: hypothetical protein Q9178_000247 [Gyalolechia marmorata]